MVLGAFQQPGLLTIVAAAVLVIVTVGVLARRARRPSTPPGPKSSWLGFGQPTVPVTYPWYTYEEWQRLYGILSPYHRCNEVIARVFFWHVIR